MLEAQFLWGLLIYQFVSKPPSTMYISGSQELLEMYVFHILSGCELEKIKGVPGLI